MPRDVLGSNISAPYIVSVRRGFPRAIWKGVAHDPNGADIRVANIGGEAWFVAADVLKLLGFSRADNTLRTIDDHEKPLAPRQVRGKQIELADARSADTSSGRNLNAGEVNASHVLQAHLALAPSYPLERLTALMRFQIHLGFPTVG